MNTPALPSYHGSLKAAVAAAYLILSLCIAGAPARAGSVTLALGVRAVVLPIAKVKIIQGPQQITVTNEDILKGYVDATPLPLIKIRTNSGKGCVLTLSAEESPFTGAEVTLQGHTILIRKQGGMIVMPAARGIVPMQYRFLLSRRARAGVYPWPYSLSVSPLR